MMLKTRPERLIPLLTLVALLVGPLLPAVAQTGADSPEMADALRQDGKFWVVVVTIAVVVAGMLVYLFRLEGKVGRLERRLNNEQ